MAKRSKFDYYVMSCGKPIREVEKAIRLGARLSREELFDHHFKRVLYKGKAEFFKSLKSKNYRRAAFMARALYFIDLCSCDEVCLASIMDCVGEIRKCAGMLLFDSINCVEVYDSNWVYYVDLLVGTRDLNAEIKTKEDFISAMFKFVNMVVKESFSASEDKYKDYVLGYLPKLYKSILEGARAVPFLDIDKSDSLNTYISISTNPYEKEDAEYNELLCIAEKSRKVQ